MFKRLIAVAAIAALSLAMTADAQAVVITSNGDVNLKGPANPAPLEDIKQISGSNGRTFTNQVSGAPFAVGGEVRTVSGIPLITATNGFESPAVFADDDQLFAVSAIRGTIISGGATATARFDLGRVFFLKVSPGTFNPADPSTWGGHLIVAEYAMASPTDVVSGFPGGSAINFDASQVNLSAVNTAGGQLTQGQFLFEEDSTPAQNALAGDFGDDFIKNVDDNSPPGQVKTFEGIFAEIDQTLLTQPNTLNAADLAVINGYYASLGIGAWASGVGGGGAGADYDPFAGGPNGDFAATFGADVHIVHGAVPEPGTLAIFAVGIAVFGGSAGVRRYRKRKNGDS